MADKLVVYAYNVLFGDAILVEVPEGQTKRFILIDAGNAMGKGGADQPLLDAIKDIKERTAGKIDLYVMTHEHFDHVQGLLLAKDKGYELQIDTVWMTASADLDYYKNNKHPGAKKKKKLEEAVEAFRKIVGVSRLPLGLQAILEVNATTDDHVNFIRHAGQNRQYIYHGCRPNVPHCFTETSFRILAPEENTAVYYERVPHFSFKASDVTPAHAYRRPEPLPGIDGGVFYELIERMDSAFSESVFAIDKARNNTSVVIELEWRGRRLLFPGDAEQRSWQIMDKETMLKPVDLLKISHHGSHNGTPPPAILDKILPSARREKAVAILSTHPEVHSTDSRVYPGVPDPQTFATIKARTQKIYSTTDVAEGKPVIVTMAAVC